MQRDQTGTFWVKIVRTRDDKIVYSEIYVYRWFALWRMKRVLRRMNRKHCPAVVINNTEV